MAFSNTVAGTRALSKKLDSQAAAEAAHSPALAATVAAVEAAVAPTLAQPLLPFKIEPNKTYATAENAIKAVNKALHPSRLAKVRYFMHTTPEGRFFPVFVGQSALQEGVHFHFNVVA